MTGERPTTFQWEEGFGTTTAETTTYREERDEGAEQLCPSYHTVSVVHLLPSGAGLKRNNWYHCAMRYGIAFAHARNRLMQGLLSESFPRPISSSGKSKSSFVAIIRQSQSKLADSYVSLLGTPLNGCGESRCMATPLLI